MGRVWLFYWLFPYPNTMGLWPQFRSPLIWDVFAVSTYCDGLAPVLVRRPDPGSGDAARPRPRTASRRVFYGVLAMGWRGSAQHWHRYHVAYMLLAGLATPLVVSVHTVVSFDFATSLLPGWHTTIFPPYFVAGAVFSGFAMVLTLAIPLRGRSTASKTSSPLRHLDNMAKITLATGLIVAYGYMMELFIGCYSGEPVRVVRDARTASPARTRASPTALLILCNVIIAAVAVVGRRSARTRWPCSSSRSSSTSGCGSSGS